MIQLNANRNFQRTSVSAPARVPCSPAKWAIILAFALLYLSWGTTYLAIRIGVESFPPALFGGSRVATAGLILLVYLAIRGESIRLRWSQLACVGVVGVLLFVGGNGLITYAEKSVASGVTSVLAATTPFWLALLETIWPRGERLRLRGWLGLFAGLGGVLLLLAEQLRAPAGAWLGIGPLLVLASAASWALGSFALRHGSPGASHLTSAAYQMLIGGTCLFVIGLALGEGRTLALEQFTPRSVYAFTHLLIVGSLVGFVAYNWLMSHVSVTLVGTYAYVNPVVAILVGWLIQDEKITPWIIGGMTIILAGVALVRSGTASSSSRRGARWVDVSPRGDQSEGDVPGDGELCDGQA